ncbi:SixA phosphatase family protein [Pontivivens insulae]|uniref:2,3-bisphosphoglycerate-dependent phosphoglycerate mutase n=1 Tax=Pontivivens insulae TaxID=1639689 RepID=A0A2R8ADZ8_9RHOB|nr:histidine phosphatase family protein [Pontivivens insulae]RED14379.1 phosphohistidine phosphatase [Pontivivens insulae]SPF30456.1 hypothetical protein POI8812_02794 [Pontivivens insulae]
MKRIVLIRHAKSSWSDPEAEDVGRPLNKRGRLAASLMGAWLDEMDLVPDAVWLSPAERTVQTWTRMRAVSGGPEGEVHKALYMADPNTMLSILRASGKAETIAIIGHQPGMSAMARKLSDGKMSTSVARALTHYPTGGVAVLEADVKKAAEIEYKSCAFTHFVIPKDLV